MGITEEAHPSRIAHYQFHFLASDATALAQFQALIAPMFHLQVANATAFSASSQVYVMNEIVFSTATAKTEHAWFHRDSSIIKSSGIDDVGVLLYKDVSFDCAIDGVTTTVEPQQLLFIDLLKPIDLFTSSVNSLFIHLPRGALENLSISIAHLHGRVLKSGPQHRLLVDYLFSLEKVAADIQAKDSFSISQTLLQLVADAVRQLHLHKLKRFAGSSRLTMQEVKHMIDQHIMDPALSVDWLATRLSVSRATLYRLFQAGQSVAQYIAARKLEYAYQQLAYPQAHKVVISTLSEQLGYRQPSAFSRAFIERYGVRPSEVRDQVAGRTKDAFPWQVALDLEQFRVKPEP